MALIQINNLTVNNNGNSLPSTNYWPSILLGLCIVGAIAWFIFTGDITPAVTLVSSIISSVC